MIPLFTHIPHPTHTPHTPRRSTKSKGLSLSQAIPECSAKVGVKKRGGVVPWGSGAQEREEHRGDERALTLGRMQVRGTPRPSPIGQAASKAWA